MALRPNLFVTVYTNTLYLMATDQIEVIFISTYSRAGGGSQTFFSTHGNHLPPLSGVHGLRDFLCSAHLLESFAGRIYSLKHSHKCNF